MTNLCTDLANRGYDIQVIGFGYDGREHHFPFRICNLPNIQSAMPMIRSIQGQGVTIDALIIALDIPLQETILRQFQAPCDIPIIGLFPLEAPPLCRSWAMSLMRLDARLIMSQFGVKALEAKGVDSTFIPIGVDVDKWRVPMPEEKEKLKQGLGIGKDTFVVLTVADNQERKNLSKAMEIFAEAFKDKDATYVMVTRPKSPAGWKLEDYAMELGIYSQMMIYDRGMAQKNLWALFAVSDCFLLTSKAEGLAMPLLEAMAMRLPCVGTDCTAIREHLEDGRGYLIDVEHRYIDPFGNAYRYWPSKELGKAHLEMLANWPEDDNELMFMTLNNAQSYVQARTWNEATSVLENTIKQVLGMRESYIKSI